MKSMTSRDFVRIFSSSRLVQGRFSMPAMNPALLFTWQPTMTFSRAVICAKSLMC